MTATTRLLHRPRRARIAAPGATATLTVSGGAGVPLMPLARHVCRLEGAGSAAWRRGLGRFRTGCDARPRRDPLGVRIRHGRGDAPPGERPRCAEAWLRSAATDGVVKLREGRLAEAGTPG